MAQVQETRRPTRTRRGSTARVPGKNITNDYPLSTSSGMTKEINEMSSKIAIVEIEDGDIVPSSPKKRGSRASRKNTVEVSSLSDTENEQQGDDMTGTPTKKRTGMKTTNVEKGNSLNMVTPCTEEISSVSIPMTTNKNVRRSLIPREKPIDSKIECDSTPALRTVSDVSSSSNETNASTDSETSSSSVVTHTMTVPSIQPNVRKLYHIVNKKTGSIGGNGSGGAIYGELTVGSMQKMVELMKTHTNLNSNSRFIDVGCGLGKPNMHVTQDPGVEFSYGIEMEHVRYILGMVNLKFVLNAAKEEQLEMTGKEDDDSLIKHRCILAHGNINEAKTFDPFTHVYMFDIGFPPTLFAQLSQMFNNSKSEYLICYHGPKLMIDRYEFDVELIIQMSTSMHGSSESHMGYLYRRVPKKTKARKGAKPGGRGLPADVPCDPLFAEHWRSVRGGLEPLADIVSSKVEEHFNAGRPRRSGRATRQVRR